MILFNYDAYVEAVRYSYAVRCSYAVRPEDSIEVIMIQICS